jgi:hypothetical protein
MLNRGLAAIFCCLASGVASRPSGAQIHLMMSGKFERMELGPRGLLRFNDMKAVVAREAIE